MKKLILASSMIVLSALAISPLTAEKSPEERITDFSLNDVSGRKVSLSDFSDKKAIVVLFIGVECPVNNAYMVPLQTLQKDYAAKGVQFLAVNSNSQDSPETVVAHAAKFKIPFPVMKDDDHRVADLFKAERTPEAFLLDARRRIVYRGRIDDQYGIGYQRPAATRRDLAKAIDELLAGKPISQPRTKAVGCIIGREKPASKVATAAEKSGTITFAGQVSRILQNNCQECHRPGQIGPFSLMTYKNARGWAETIREVVTDGRMPPWHADPRYGKFANDRRLSPADRATLLAWIDQGCPEGESKDLPPPRKFRGEDGWVIGKPDAVFSMKEEFKVPAKAPPGGVPYKYFVVPTNLKEDVWVQAAEARPGNRSVVHHIIVLVVGPGKSTWSAGDRIGEGHLVGAAPGDMPLILPSGIAKKIPKGSNLIFQMHYTPNGVEQTDRSSVGLIFAKEPPHHTARTRAIMQTKFEIPPGDGNHEVKSETKFNKDAIILSFMPHMHVRGKSFEYRAVYPDGRSEVLLSVPRYDFGWQSTYRLDPPLKLPAGTEIRCTAHFDNSEQNPNNPDPAKPVRWGEQTWEEMMIGWTNYYYADEKPVAGG